MMIIYYFSLEFLNEIFLLSNYQPSKIFILNVKFLMKPVTAENIKKIVLIAHEKKQSLDLITDFWMIFFSYTSINLDVMIAIRKRMLD